MIVTVNPAAKGGRIRVTSHVYVGSGSTATPVRKPSSSNGTSDRYITDVPAASVSPYTWCT